MSGRTAFDVDLARTLIDRKRTQPGATLPILHDLLEQFGYIDDAAIPLIADERTAQQLAADPAIAAPIAAALQHLAASIRTGAANAAAGSQPIGRALPHWQRRPLPERRSFHGLYARIEPLDPALHAEPLYAALCNPSGAAAWTYLPSNPPATTYEWRSRLEQCRL